jgi:L-alanine-DL-glutamate epimerase-like enolase superfamily enzyme
MGEHIRDLHEYGKYLRRGAADALRCWDVNVGGITPMYKIATLAEVFNMNCEIVSWGNP